MSDREQLLKAQIEDEITEKKKLGWQKVGGSWEETEANDRFSRAVVNRAPLFGGDYYANEENNSWRFRGNAQSEFEGQVQHGIVNTTTGESMNRTEHAFEKQRTMYFRGEEAERFNTSVKDGKIVDAEGNALDTTGASTNGRQAGSGSGSFIYAMNDDGQVRAIDSWKERRYELQGEKKNAMPHWMRTMAALTDDEESVESLTANSDGEVEGVKPYENPVSLIPGKYDPERLFLDSINEVEQDSDSNATKFLRGPEADLGFAPGIDELYETKAERGPEAQLGLSPDIDDLYAKTEEDSQSQSNSNSNSNSKTDSQASMSSQSAKGGTSGPTQIAGEDEYDPRDTYNMAWINHSSLFAGNKVSGAGEITVEDGELKKVNNSSGHYQPDENLLYQTVGRFEDQGVAMEGVSVGLAFRGKDQSRSESTNWKKGMLNAGALEFLSYNGARNAGEKMRNARVERNAMMNDIRKFDLSSLKKVSAGDKKDTSGPETKQGVTDKIERLRRLGVF